MSAWGKAEHRRDLYAVALAQAYVAGNSAELELSVEMFKSAEAELRRLDTEADQ